MVHYGKHIIDPDTGLCEICDRGAISEFRKKKGLGRQFLYSNQDGKFTYRPKDEEIYNNNYETKPRHVRKPLYPEPPPPVRTRPIVHEEPAIIRKKTPRPNHSPINDHQHHNSARPATFYYVNNTGQMLPRNEGPPEEPHRQYIVQNHHSPPTTRPPRAVNRRAQTPPPHRVVNRRAHTPPPHRVVNRRAQTPPPPASESWRSQPKRQHNSDAEITHRPYIAKSNDSDYNHSPRKSEMYYIDRNQHDNRFTTISSIVQTSHDHHTQPPKNHYQGDTNRQQRHLEPVERKRYIEPEPTVVRKVYKKLPASKYEPTEHEYIPNGNHVQPVRKFEKIYPPPRTYDSSPQLTNRHTRSPLSNKHAAVYHIRSIDE